MLRGLEGWHFIILAAVVAVLFGYKRMPDAARSMGRSMRIFKSEVETMRKDDKPDAPTAPPAPVTAPVATPVNLSEATAEVMAHPPVVARPIRDSLI